MARTSKLFYTTQRQERGHSQDAEGEVLFSSQSGVPLLWIFCFGGRNIWDPGDDVIARGGAAGERNPYETPIEVAITRLEQAQSAVENDPHLWPWLSAMAILRRKLMTKPKKGFIRLVAPWIAQLGETEYEQWRRTTAYAENCVNFISVGREAEARASLFVLEPYCPFVPRLDGNDPKRIAEASVDAQPEAVRLALLTVGIPQNRELLSESAQREITPLLEEVKKLAPLELKMPNMETKAAPTKGGQGKPGLLGKLGGMFRRK